MFWIVYIKLTNHYILKSKNKVKKQSKNPSFKKKIWKQIFSVLISLMLFLVYILFMFATPYIKGSINDNYLQEIVNDIIKGENTDAEKIGALLNWFDRNSENMYNSWYLVHNNKVLLSLIPNHFFILSEMPYFGIRCSEDMDGKWIITSRFGACGEYSRVFLYMADSIGINVRRVHANGEDHLWNEVKINNNWMPVDPTNVSLPDSGDGWEDYSFFEWKEGNVSYVWAEYLHNNTIEDLTYKYTDLTNVTIHVVDQNNNSVSDVTITIMSNNLQDSDRIHKTFIKGKSKPKTNKTGYCAFQIGGGTYKFKVDTEKYIGKTEWVECSDTKASHNFTLALKKK